MYKVLSLIKKRDDMSAEEFRRWATEEHPKLAKAIPGMVKYVVNVNVTDDPDAAFHCVNEMYFPDKAAFEAGFGSEAGKAAGADAAATAANRVRLVVEQHELI